MISLLWACMESPLPLPPSRLVSPSSGMMVQYGTLQGYLVKRGEVQQRLIWVSEILSDEIKRCALDKVKQDTQALVVTTKFLPQAQTKYPSSIPMKFTCP